MSAIGIMRMTARPTRLRLALVLLPAVCCFLMRPRHMWWPGNVTQDHATGSLKRTT